MVQSTALQCICMAPVPFFSQKTLFSTELMQLDIVKTNGLHTQIHTLYTNEEKDKQQFFSSKPTTQANTRYLGRTLAFNITGEGMN